MFLGWLKAKRVEIVALFTLVSLTCAVNATYAFPPIRLPSNKIILGVRTISSPVKDFCDAFGATLEEKTASG